MVSGYTPVNAMPGLQDQTGPSEPTEGGPAEGDPTDDKEFLILITILGTVITLTLIVCIIWLICCKCFRRTCKITSAESQSISTDLDNYYAKDDDPNNVVIRGYHQTPEQRRNPWNRATYGLNRAFTPGLDPGGDIYAIARPAMFADTPSQLWQREPQHRALDARSSPDQYTYTYDGLFRSPVGKSSALALTPTDGGPGSGPSFHADHQLQELVRTDMTRSETIMVGSKLVVFISREVSHLGDTLVLQEMGISLSIPPYAIQAGHTERISLILDWDLGDFPSMRDEETIISPVVHCGPHGLELNKPAVLSYRHCAYDVGDVSLVASETHLMQNKEWREVCARDDGNRPYTIFPNEVQVQLSHFTLYTCLAEGKTTAKAIKKWMQLAVFGGKMRAKHRYEIRVYLLNNTPCALQFAVQNEAKNHFKMLCPRKEFLFHGDGEDMLATVQYVNEGWSHRLDDRQERVPFLSLWHGKCPHVSFIFKHEDDHVRDIDIKLVLHQHGRENIESEKTNLKVLASMKSSALSKRRSETIGSTNKAVINVFPQGKRGKRIRYNSTSSLSSSSNSISWSSSEGSDVSSSPSSSSDNTSSSAAMDKDPLSKPNDQSTQQPCTQNMQIYITGDESPLPTSLTCAGTPRTIPHELCMELVLLLDPMSPLGNDWRAIASALELDSLIPLLKNTPSYKPTETLLDEVEHQCKGLEWLASVLVKARRLDAANIVMKYVNMDKTCVNNES